MIDTHAHLDDEKFDGDREQVLKRSFESGVEKIINIGADREGSLASVRLAREYENVYAAIGLHPHVFNEDSFSPDLDELEKMAEDKKVLAIGEIGLDYFDHSGGDISEVHKENQKKGFISQIELAQKLELPVVVHCRPARNDSQAKRSDSGGDAYEDTLEIIKNYPAMRFVFHCYGGNLEFTKKLLELEKVYFLSLETHLYQNRSEVFEVVGLIPLERMMLETDCPYWPQCRIGARGATGPYFLCREKLLK
jgi:TatD DNase family protein